MTTVATTRPADDNRASVEADAERARSARSPSVRVRIPVRVDFAGGWSDVPYFSGGEGGAVVNAAIDHYVEGRASSTTEGMQLEYRTDIPKGSGLGASAALDVAWLALTNGLMRRTITPTQLAEDAYRVEKVLGVEGGKQDQYAAALGGFNHLVFGPESDPASAESLALDPAVVAALEDRLILCYTGSAHDSGSLHERVWEPFLGGDRRIAAALRRIRDSAPHARDALLRGDLDALGELLTVNLEGARQLVPELVTSRMDELFAIAMKAGAAGAKGCGAGGGGCAIVLARDGRADEVRAALRGAGVEIMAFRFESTSWWGENAPGAQT
jgi:D-glycero-alpha-D-manno-heptose-7-phosphate kinase